MSPPKSRNRAAEDRAAYRQLELRSQEELRELITRLERGRAGTGVSLDPYTCGWLSDTLSELSEGYDLRESFGIRAKPGARPYAHYRDRFLASAFLRFKKEHPEIPDKRHYATLSEATGLTEARLRKIVSANRDKERYIPQDVTTDAIIKMLAEA